MSNTKLVFSTETGSHRKNKPEAAQLPKKGPVKMRLETAGRGGKAVTVLFDLPWSADEAKTHQRAMQAAFGCGGAFKDQTIELRGDVRDKVEQYLAKKAVPVKRAGG